jgi:hypothetical protein
MQRGEERRGEKGREGKEREGKEMRGGWGGEERDETKKKKVIKGYKRSKNLQ